jgi:isoprenylcysteine carboxyl methyltransferase (ICMT) family protein YpbQ
MKYFDMYITLIFIVKVAFIILAVYSLYIKAKKPKDTKLKQTIQFWKERMEFLFITLMSIFLIYLFNPRANNLNMISGEAKLLLYLFGFVLLLTESWSSFIHESPLFKKFQSVLA